MKLYDVGANPKRARSTLNPHNSNEEKYGSGSDNCNVCQEKILKNQQIVELECGHIYHTHCARKWVLDERTCPTCRKGVNPPKVNGTPYSTTKKDGSTLSQFSTGRKSDVTSLDLLSSIKKLEKPRVVINAPMPDIL